MVGTRFGFFGLLVAVIGQAVFGGAFSMVGEASAQEARFGVFASAASGDAMAADPCDIDYTVAVLDNAQIQAMVDSGRMVVVAEDLGFEEAVGLYMQYNRFIGDVPDGVAKTEPCGSGAGMDIGQIDPPPVDGEVCPFDFTEYRDTGESLDCLCESSPLGGEIWGTGIYTDDSPLCTAAVHAGVIGQDGGYVLVEPAGSQQSFNGSSSNGVDSSEWGAWDWSYTFAGADVTMPPDTPTDTTVSGSCPYDFTEMRDTGGSLTCVCEAADIAGEIWGTGVYTDDSAICLAAVHAGVIGQNGGEVTAQAAAGQESYPASERNGVQSSEWVQWDWSFDFAGADQVLAVPQTTAVACPYDFTAHRDGPDSLTCDCTTDAFYGDIWGTDVYTDDSSICQSALHAGMVDANGGQITVVAEGPQGAYPPSDQNGVTSQEWGEWDFSFGFSGDVEVVAVSPPAGGACPLDFTGHRDGPDSLTCTCGPDSFGGDLWGTGVYTDDSTICLAALHAGAVSQDGGEVTVEARGPQSNYPPSARNGVTSSEWGDWEFSYSFAGVEVAAVEPPPEGACPLDFTAHRDGPDSLTCTCGPDAFYGDLWGTGVYTDDSSICLAARHAGAVSQDGGEVTVEARGPQSSYPPSAQNGVSSSEWGDWEFSYSFAGVEVTAVKPLENACPLDFTDYRGSDDLVTCECGPGTMGGDIWGTAIYTDDSSVCTAALHAGVVGPDGGRVMVIPEAGASEYPATNQNGIQSSEWGSWDWSFTFKGANAVVPEVVEEPPTKPGNPEKGGRR